MERRQSLWGQVGFVLKSELLGWRGCLPVWGVQLQASCARGCLSKACRGTTAAGALVSLQGTVGEGAATCF